MGLRLNLEVLQVSGSAVPSLDVALAPDTAPVNSLNLLQLPVTGIYASDEPFRAFTHQLGAPSGLQKFAIQALIQAWHERGERLLTGLLVAANRIPPTDTPLGEECSHQWVVCLEQSTPNTPNSQLPRTSLSLAA